MEVEKLADELIALRCGTHSLGLIYEFLLKSYRDPNQAKAEFVRFLSGELSHRLLEEAELCVSEEQDCDGATADETLSQLSYQGQAYRRQTRLRPASLPEPTLA
jgi:hypothetical protein